MPNNDAIIAFLCPFPEVKANGNSEIAGIFKPFQFEVIITKKKITILVHPLFNYSFIYAGLDLHWY